MSQAYVAGVEHDFYRCVTCQRLLTQPELTQALTTGNETPCPCGGARFSPTNLTAADWRWPRVWTFAVQRLLGRA
jgi:DNA-directed RNA polymerase subunit RPC12/RpoP